MGDPVSPLSTEAQVPEVQIPSQPQVAWWRTLLSQYFVPTAIASLVATLLSIYAAVTTAHEKQQEYNQRFESLVNDAKILSVFSGSAQSIREEQATATLLALQSVAESETQRRTVLLIGGRLLNADPTNAGTGEYAARLLTILIDEANRGRHSWNPFERSVNARLWGTVTSASFLDLVTAGYSNDYYNDYGDPTKERDFRPYWPTLNGDAPVSHNAKFEVLWELTAPQYEGWVHLATFAYHPPRRVVARRDQRSRGSAQPALTPGTAADLVRDVTDVMLRHDLRHVGAVEAQYAIPDPRETPLLDPLFRPPELLDRSRFPASWVMLRPRLLRIRPPVEYVNPDGTFRKGSLGRIVGVVPAGSCIKVVEPLVPALVFLPSYVVADRPEPKKNLPVAYTGLVHMWAHVRSTKDDERCLSSIAPPR